MISLLTGLFPGAWAPYAETLVCAASWPAEAIPLLDLVQHDTLLGQLIGDYAAHLGVTGSDRRAPASAWSQAYLWALLPPVTAAASVLQHRFPMRSSEVAVTFNTLGRPLQFHILQEGAPALGRSVSARYGPLLEEHLAPLFLAISRQTRLPLKILWGNAARYLDDIFEQALTLTGHAPHVAGDRQQLLRTATGPDGRPNPLYGRRRVVTCRDAGIETSLALYAQCCLYYRLSGKDYCRACPLAPQYTPANGDVASDAAPLILEPEWFGYR